VLVTVWAIVGAAVGLVLMLSRTLDASPYGLAVMGAVGVGAGVPVARAVRPHVRFGETAAGVVIAFVLLPGVGRWDGIRLDAMAWQVLGVGVPLGLGVAWVISAAKLRVTQGAELLVAMLMMMAAIGLGLIFLQVADPHLSSEHGIEAAFGLGGALAGLSLGALVANTHWYQPLSGAALAFVVPRMLQLGVMKYMPLGGILKWVVVMGGAGAIAWCIGVVLRRRMAARHAGAAVVPTARVHDGDAGERSAS